MAKNSVLGKPFQQANLSRHGFNMSHNFKFTSSCGHLLPVFYDFMNPGETYKISYDLFTRTQPLATAAMVDIDEYIETFFVPLSMINHRANEILMGISDKWSDMFTNEYQDMPLVDPAVLDYQQMPQEHPWLPSGDGFFFGAMRLCDMFNIAPDYAADLDTSFETHVTEEQYKPLINPMYFAAYQAVWYSYYRLTNWSNNNIAAYNLDSVQNRTTGSNGKVGNNQFVSLFTIQYRPYQRDYFRALEPSPLINSIGLYQGSSAALTSINQWLGSLTVQGETSEKVLSTSNVASISSSLVNQRVVNTAGNQTNVLQDITSNNYNLTSPTAIRTMFAVDKLLRVTGLAGKHYDDQVMAHFGFRVPKEYSNEVTKIAEHHQLIHIGEVISTASTDEAVLGTLAGKGYAKGNSEPKTFTAPCHGIIIALYSCVPRIDNVGGIDKLHSAYRRQDFYIPELDNLGMQPLFGYETYAIDSQANSRYGWQYRYMQYKTKYDRTTRAFVYFRGQENPTIRKMSGSFQDWAIAWHPTRNSSVGEGYSVYSLYSKPIDLDPIMLQHYDVAVTPADYGTNGPTALYMYDPLIHSLRISAFKTSTMSIYGLEKDL